MSNALVLGADRNYCSALVALDETALRDWARKQARRPAVRRAGRDAAGPGPGAGVRGPAQRGLQRWQTIKKFRLLPRDLDVEHGELTPSLKLKRPVVERAYGNLIEEMYQGTREA